MIAIVAGVVVLVALVVVWARIGAGRAERHSVATYEHALGVLGGVARRRESETPVHKPTEEELARPHVQAHPEDGPVRPVAGNEVPPPRLRLHPPTIGGEVSGDAVAASSPPLPEAAASDAVTNDAGAPEVVISFDDTEEVTPPGASRRRHRDLALGSSHYSTRRLAAGAAALIVLAALGVGGWRLASSPPNSPPAPAPAPVTPPAAKAIGGTPEKHASPPPAPSTLTPVSVTSTLVSYAVPASSYTLAFSATGVCWVGVEQQATGPYLWDATLSSAQAGSYAAQGAVLVNIGAPAEISTITVSGVPLALPEGRVAPYRIALTPAGAEST